MSKEYRDKVVRLIQERTGEPLLNGSIDDAAVIAQEAFNYAKKSVCVLTNKLSPDCWARESVRNSAKVFLADSTHTLRVLIESPMWDKDSTFDWSKHPFVESVRNAGHCEIKFVPKEWTERYKFNCLLLDDYGYRFEADRNSRAAVAAFFADNQKENAVGPLRHSFETLWRISTPLTMN